jgi:AcrR family transcriptional regulator
MNLALLHIASQGTEKLSLRALAREAHVSPTAPFRHFPNKQALFAALATEGFYQLGDQIRVAIQSTHALDDRVLAGAMSYIQFAEENPVAYQLMFGAILGDFSEFEGLSAAAGYAYESLDQLLLEVVEVKQLPIDELVLGGLIWSTIHGFASLRLNVLQEGEPQIELRPRKALMTMSADLESNIKSMLDGLLGQSA